MSTIEVASRRVGNAVTSSVNVVPLMHACVVACPRPEANVVRREVFFAAATHDLKTPLSSLTLWMDVLQILKPRLQAGGDAQAIVLLDQALEQMQTLVQRSLNLIEDALDGSRLEAGSQLPFMPGEVDLVALVRQVLQGRPQNTEHPVRFDSAQCELWGWWDAGRLARLLDNLLANAIKYSPRGQPITVRVAFDESLGQSWAVVEVEDCGVGIPSADLPNLFEPFQRGPHADPTVAGNGLGLWWCRTIVEQHGGTLSVASREGEGTTVTVCLPLEHAPPAA
jgi:signal transduction histidine kinase